MVIIARNHGGDLVLPLVFEEEVLVIGPLALPPCVEGFVDNVKAEFVAGLEQCRAWWIVGAADCIVTRLFENPNFAKLDSPCAYGSDDAVVVMQAPAFEKDGLTVNLEALNTIDGNGAQTEYGGGGVVYGSVNKNIGCQRVEMGRVGAPKFGMGEGDFAISACRDNLAVGIGYGLANGIGDISGRQDRGLDLDDGLLFVGDPRCQANTLRCDAGDGAGEEVDGAVESGTGVPARGGE